MKILLIEDEIELRNSIIDYFKHEDHIVEFAVDYDKALEKITTYNYDCVLVDITLPKGTGLDIIKQLKKNDSKAGVIIISANNSDDDKIQGLNLGADDYLAKPFSLAELNARVKAIIRRRNFEGNNTIVMNEISISPEERLVKVHNAPLILTAKEYDLLLFFVANKNRVVSKNTIAEHLWGDDADQFNNFDFIYVHLRNLRKKLAEKGCEDYVQTIYGVGYNFKI